MPGASTYARMRELAQTEDFQRLSARIAEDEDYRQLCEKLVERTQALQPRLLSMTSQQMEEQFVQLMAGLNDPTLQDTMTRLGEKMIDDPEVQQVVQSNSSVEQQQRLRARLAYLESDADAAAALRELEEHGPVALVRHALNFELLEKLAGAAFGDPMPGDSANTSAIQNDSSVWDTFFNQNMEGMREVLERGANANYRVPAQEGLGTNFTVLHAAAVYNDVAAVRLLLQHGADVDARADVGPAVAGHSSTPLHWAVAGLAGGDHMAATVQALLDANPDKQAANAAGQTPIDVCTHVMDTAASDSLETACVKTRKLLRA